MSGPPSPSPASRLRTPALVAAAVVVTLALWVLAAEATLRGAVRLGLGGEQGFTGFVQRAKTLPRSDPLYRVSDDPGIGIELRPGATRGPVRINRHGFRGPEVGVEKPPGVTRIAMLGDSETFAARLEEQETLGGALADELARAGLGPVETLNFGVPGYDTSQEWHVLRKRVLPFDPDVVVLYYVFNDPELADHTLLLGSGPLSRSYLYMFVRWMGRSDDAGLEAIKRNARTPSGYYLALHESERFAACADWIRRMGDLLHERGTRFVVVIAPELTGYTDLRDYPYGPIHDALRALASTRIEVVDPLPELARLRHDPRAFWVTPWDPHKNAAATRAIARRLARTLATPEPGTQEPRRR